MAKAKQRFAWTYDHAKGIVSVKDTETGSERTFQVSDYPEEIQGGLTAYGLGKKLQDSQSQTDADDKFAGFDATSAQLIDGKWNAAKTGGSRLLPAIIEVIMEFKGWSVAKAQKSFKALDDDAKAALIKGQAKRIEEVLEARKDESESSLEDMLI